MATAAQHPVIRYIRRLSVGPADGPSDGELLGRFARQRDGAAFEALVRRHGPAVLGACRRVLRDAHAAEDAFQATFLVLARKAGALERPAALGPWLYGVAVRTALKARAGAARRRQQERQAAAAEAVAADDGPVWRELRPLLDEAVARLPEKYRVPFVLHHVEGRTVEDVAGRLGCPRGTVAARLARARQRLRARLVRRGVALSAAALVAALAEGVAAAVPAALVARTGRAVVAGAVPAGAAALADGVLRGMMMTKLKAVVVALAVGLAGTAGGVAAWQARAAAPAAGAAKPAVDADGDRLLFLAGSLHFLVEEDYRAAGRAFNLLLKKYPDSRLAPKAAELAVLARQLTSRADAGKANEGRREIEAVLAAERKDAEAQQAEKDFAIAEFYRETGHAGAAYFYYELVRRRHPGTPCAVWAEARMGELRAKAAKPTPAAKPPARVGQIIIIGNTKTPAEVILKHVPLYPGQVLSYPDLKAAEKKLEQTGRFVVDPGKGTRPTVTVRDNPAGPEGTFKDIIITVQEAKTGSLMFGVGVNGDAGLTGSIRLNERNFDVRRVPTSSDDLPNGTTHRGAGQELRVPPSSEKKK
jgi:RNA polymerase sigma factor (sigma-70 family)